MRKSKQIKNLSSEIDILKQNVERLDAMVYAIMGKKKVKDPEIESGKWYKDEKTS